MTKLTLTALCAAVSCLAAAPSIPLSEYKERRAALRQAAGDSVVILFGRTERETGDLRSPFFQEPNFYYLTGWNEPGAILVITPKAETLLLPRRDPVAERWTGKKAAPRDPNVSASTGFEKVVETEQFESLLPGWLQTGRNVMTLGGTEMAERLKALLPLREIQDASTAVARLRMKKSDAELALIQYATDVGMDAHRAAWKRIQPGLSEYQIAAAMGNVYFERGCERHAYSPIVGAGPNAAVLHYSRNNRRMDSGELLLMDVGPECSMYATDITRTVPVNGKWTKRQRELYDIVLGAQKAAIAAVKPGAILGSRHSTTGLRKIVLDYLDKHGGLGKYFIHGLGHHIGLDVHDAFDPALPLEAGHVVTIEPGVYIPEEGIGIRIEDVVLVTENGAKVLSQALPREPNEIERAMGSK